MGGDVEHPDFLPGCQDEAGRVRGEREAANGLLGDRFLPDLFPGRRVEESEQFPVEDRRPFTVAGEGGLVERLAAECAGPGEFLPRPQGVPPEFELVPGVVRDNERERVPVRDPTGRGADSVRVLVSKEDAPSRQVPAADLVALGGDDRLAVGRQAEGVHAVGDAEPVRSQAPGAGRDRYSFVGRTASPSFGLPTLARPGEIVPGSRPTRKGGRPVMRKVRRSGGGHGSARGRGDVLLSDTVGGPNTSPRSEILLEHFERQCLASTGRRRIPRAHRWGCSI